MPAAEVTLETWKETQSSESTTRRGVPAFMLPYCPERLGEKSSKQAPVGRMRAGPRQQLRSQVVPLNRSAGPLQNSTVSSVTRLMLRMLMGVKPGM